MKENTIRKIIITKIRWLKPPGNVDIYFISYDIQIGLKKKLERLLNGKWRKRMGGSCCETKNYILLFINLEINQLYKHFKYHLHKQLLDVFYEDGIYFANFKLLQSTNYYCFNFKFLNKLKIVFFFNITK